MAPPTATPQQTIEKLLELSGRGDLPLANSFVQLRAARNKPAPGPLARFVSAGHQRALHQYLLAHAAASAAPWSVARDSRVWARALWLNPAQESARSAISKNWAWLEEAQLVSRGRRARLSDITLLRDDASGQPYDAHPADRHEPYFKLPYAFWMDDWHRHLDLASTAVLLIALSLNDGFVLPGEHVQAWYGISPSTLTKGLRGLRRGGLLDVRRNQKSAPLAPEGHTWEYTYTLKAPFGPKGRRARRGQPS